MKIILTATIILSTLTTVSAKDVNIHDVINTLSQIESNHTSDAIGDNGKAVGILQIHKCLVDDVNRITKSKNFTYAQRLKPAYSRLMARIYLKHYSKSFKKRFKRNPKASELAMMWNGGGQYYRGLSKKKSKRNNLNRYVAKFNSQFDK